MFYVENQESCNLKSYNDKYYNSDIKDNSNYIDSESENDNDIYNDSNYNSDIEN
jgi:hypothetical protein